MNRHATVGEVMSSELVAASPDEHSWIAEERAKAMGVRHLLVMEKRELLGVLCMCDLAVVPDHSTVSDAMTRAPKTIPADAPLYEAAHLLTSERIGCLPVTKSGAVIGILTRRDLRKAGFAVTHEDLTCASCGSTLAVHADDIDAPGFCLECLRQGASPEEWGDLGGSD